MSTWKPAITQYIQAIETEFDRISIDRRGDLMNISRQLSRSNNPHVIVICTHNSRRSHFGQIWLQVAADYFGKDLQSFSGGTEATAFHSNAVGAIERVGFAVEKDGEKNNPLFLLSYKDGSHQLECFSKKFDDAANPQNDFTAIMVCDSAAEACPFVPGASARFVLPYHDPKDFDGTGQEQEKYDERCREIGREMFFIVKNL